MKRCIVIALLAGLCLSSMALAAEETLESVEAKAAEAWAKCKSLTADIDVTADIPLGKTRLNLSGTGTLACLKEDGKEKFRQEFTAKMPEPMTMEAKIDALFDGTDFYATTEIFNKKNTEKSKPSLDQGAIPPGGGALFSSLKEELDLTLMPDEEVDGSACYVIEGTLKEKADSIPFSKAAIYIDKEIGVQRKIALFENDTVAATFLFKNIKTDVDIPAATFVYTPDTPAAPAAPKASEPAAATESK